MKKVWLLKWCRSISEWLGGIFKRKPKNITIKPLDDDLIDDIDFLHDRFGSGRAMGYGSKEYIRDGLINFEQVTNLVDRTVEVYEDDKTITLTIDENTVLLDVEETGEYHCIYDYKIKKDENVGKGTVLCIVNPAIYDFFTGIKKLHERLSNITSFSQCSPEQRAFVIEKAKMKAVEVDKENADTERRTSRDIITNPASLEMMFNLCKHTLPVNLRYKCQELISRKGFGHSSDTSKVLADILYTCIVEEKKQPFLSTEECLKEFNKKRFGEDPWVRDIIRQIRLLDRCENTGTVFVLVGQPGTGKTSIGEVIAICTHKKFAEIHCRNKNAMEIGGSDFTYANSHQGEVVEALKNYGNDSCILLDEFEKMVINEKEGDPYSLFISTWDDRKTFTDNYTQVPVPTQNVIWVITVNSIDNIPDHIINRFHENIFILDKYTAKTKAEIGRRFIVPRLVKRFNFTEDEVVITDEGLLAIAKTTNDAGVRNTAQKIEKILSLANEELENNTASPVIVDEAFVESYLNDAAKTYDEKKVAIGF